MHIAERPNMSNMECRQLLNLFIRDVFLSKQILQSARSSAKFELFGDPVENAHYTRAMLPSEGQRIKGPLEETKPKEMQNQALREPMEKSKKKEKE